MYSTILLSPLIVATSPLMEKELVNLSDKGTKFSSLNPNNESNSTFSSLIFFSTTV